ncbi:Z1 domain-containing protein [Desulfoluna butyratoxydans]|uniref:Putative endonuclease z1 domain n=1 Tax=Desulfoluna butyratoxydans TaxID=231438 RepID=A0A4U8YI19_9BACT|nr:Z1 domain-containing protein [Desulfoluna butyratoxydans]VFQ42970.1 putative endonuclease z1 domain [Desulfoluna butyratoxydans]
MLGIDKLIDAVALILEKHDPPTDEALFEITKAQAMVISMTDGENFNDNIITQAVRSLQARFVHRMPMGALFESEEYRPWLAERQGDIDWYYWERYRKHLSVTKGFSPRVVRTLDTTTDNILDRLEDPHKKGEWAKRGMVVGHVQSGKTANYTGLVCKAADAGYQVIIVLAGLLNSLRNQTQERLDSDFMGWCTRVKDLVGVSRFGTGRRPVCFTSSVEDFKKATANSTAMNLDALNEPVLFVLKKNKSTLENLYGWLSEHNKHNLREFSMLMIDDEADHASVNTNKEDKKPTTINKAIRDLLSLFSRSSFVGYTATPFANIFIDPDNDHEMENGENYKDLFPRDFILSLEPPDNYIGPHRIFVDDADIDCIRSISDNEDLLPAKHKIDFIPDILPSSLKKAVNCFILARAIRLLRGQERKHHSMMINASRFTDVQNILKGIVSEHVKEIRHAVKNYAALSPEQAVLNKVLKSLYDTWYEEYRDAVPEWNIIQTYLKKAINPIEVISINSVSKDVLDYSPDQYPNGRSLIAIGGLGLSRGLTLEGLMVSYFLRNSIMYDTLMQMGRWFGYRDGYADICRIFMTDEAKAWYAHIAESTEELRSDFWSMEKAKLTPLEFGLRVRSHPTALIVTARNKMRCSKDVPVNISLEGRLAETSVVYADDKIIQHNQKVLEKTILSAEKYTARQPTDLGFLWRSVPSDIVKSAIENYENHPECMLTYSEPLIGYLEKLSTEGMDTCDILLRSVKSKDSKPHTINNELIINTPKRTVAVFNNSKIEFSKRRVASKGDEKVGIPYDEVLKIQSDFAGKNVPDREYRKYKWDQGHPPLFMINFIEATAKDNSKSTLVPCFGLSLPGNPASGRRPERTVQYRVNTVWWRKNYLVDQEEEDEEE